jgi:tetratricopeptide (TPR) repeat protein
MARLLDAMRDEIHAAADRGDTANTKATADEAAKLAERLLAWAAAHTGRLGAGETLTVTVWRAWAVQQAGRAKEALEIYEQAAKAPPEALPANSALRVEIRLGQAECLLALDGAAEGLTICNEVLGQVPEHSPNWWRAYVGTLSSHSKLKHDREQIVQSIRQQRKLHPDLGGPAIARELKRIEEENTAPAKK